jgi:hypothetical protein
VDTPACYLTDNTLSGGAVTASLGHAVSRRVGIFRQVTVGFPGEVPVDGVFEGVEVLDGDDGGHGLAVARDDGRRSVLGSRDDLGEVRAGIPDPPAKGMIMNPSRATLQTRPRIQRALVRSWEYIQPVRVTFLVIRLLVVLWLVVLSAILLSSGIAWGWTLLPAAVAVFALNLWVFATAAKGWPAVEA